METKTVAIEEQVFRCARAQLMAWWLDKLHWVDAPSDEQLAEARTQATRILEAAD